jgi:septum formation protein
MSSAPDLVLASASPRRRELLERVGLVPLVRPGDVDETPRPNERAADYVRRIAAAKCDVVADGPNPEPPLAVVAADTIVIVDADILGKPRDETDARAMLSRLAGRRHDVTTAYRIRFGTASLNRAVTTTVSFRALQDRELDAYIASGEWRGKAGGYAVQGIAAAFVTEVRGSITNVIGLPLAELLADLQAMAALPRYPPVGFGAP